MLDLRSVSILADYFVICSSGSERQSRAMQEAVAGWILMDYGDVVLHIFSPEKRAYYRLEELWHQAPVVVKMQ